MPARAKSVENMTKHLTKTEANARTAAEESVTPVGLLDPASPPKSLAGDNAARRYWRRILLDAADCELYSKLDADMLALYCSMLSRRNRLNTLLLELMDAISCKKADELNISALDRLRMVEKIDGLSVRAQALEKQLLAYAKELGLTPSGRAHLARKRATVENKYDDLFGD